MLFEGAHSDEASNEADDEGCDTPNEDHGWGEDVPHGVGVFGAFHLGFNVGEIVVGVNKYGCDECHGPELEDGVRQGVGEFSLVVATAGDGVADESGDDGGGDNVPDVPGEHHAQPGDEAEDGK